MLYKFDKEKMNYVIATKSYLKLLLIILTFSVLSFITASYMQDDKLDNIKYITD